MQQTATVTHQHSQPDTHRIDADQWYSVHALARSINSGTRPFYRAIVRGELKASKINDRGDLRIRGAWAIEWLERRAQNRETA